MSDERGGIPIRSFRVVFALERRIHKIDRIRLPLPYGLPLRSIAYWLAALLAVLVFARLPVIGALLGAAPTPVRLALLPTAAAYALTQLHPDGRPAHWFLLAWARQRLGSRYFVGLAAARRQPLERLNEFVTAPDERSVGYRAGVVEGPAVVLLRMPVVPRARGRTLRLEPDGDQPLFRGHRLALSAGQRAVLG